MRHWFSLENTTCVLAGANGLLGRATAKALLDCGAEVVSIDRSFTDEPFGRPEKVDITQAAELYKFFERLPALGKATEKWSFINCSYPRTTNWGKLGFENFTPEDWNRNVEMHLGSAFQFTQHAVRFLKERSGGSIINFGSIYGVQGPDLRIYEGTSLQNPAAYAAIKSGIIGLTRYVATAYGSHKIRANVICPGGISDNQPQSFVKAYESRTPLERMGNPDDVAGMVAFLAGPSAEYITGQTLMVDGGWTAW